MADMPKIERIYRTGKPREWKVALNCGHTFTASSADIQAHQLFIGKQGQLCRECETWTGRRIRTKIKDRNEVERGPVVIPIGWTATVEQRIGMQDGYPTYQVAWDDGPDGDMGWCIWSTKELTDFAEVIA